jgi:hypothetical protein
VLAYSKIRRRVVAAPPRPASEAAGGVRLIWVARGAGERPIVFVPLKVTPPRARLLSLSLRFVPLPLPLALAMNDVA